jgi:phosphatidate phosphatase APP1
MSGFDDVLRQAENTGLLKAAMKIFEEDRTFTGMPELYTAIAGAEADPLFTLVSGISTLFDQRINQFLTKTKFPESRRFLRNWWTEWSIEDFKIARINQILTERPLRKFIVIFDNSTASIDMVGQIRSRFSKSVEVVYLHQVVSRDVPPGAFAYYTAFDIAVNEFLAHRMSASEVLLVGDAISKEENVESIFPTYSVCPKRYNPCPSDAGIEDICSKVKSHVESLCARSKKD